MSTRLRWIFACAAVGVFATVVAAGPTALAHDRKDRKQERHHKSKQHGKDDRVRKAPVRSYVELNRQIDELRQQLAALGQLPGEMSTLKLRVDSMSTQWSSVSSQWSSDMTRLWNEMAGLGAVVDKLDGRVMALELDAGSGSGSSLPALYDAKEQKMGNVISLDQGGTAPWVAFNEGGHLFALKAISDQTGLASQRLAGATVRFTATDCGASGAGLAYLDPHDANTLMTPPLAPFSIALAGVNHLGMIYVAAANANPVSASTASSVGPDGFCVSGGPSRNFFGLVPVVMILQTTFTPPFVVH